MVVWLLDEVLLCRGGGLRDWVFELKTLFKPKSTEGNARSSTLDFEINSFKRNKKVIALLTKEQNVKGYVLQQIDEAQAYGVVYPTLSKSETKTGQ
jgi:hypothetical protein